MSTVAPTTPTSNVFNLYADPNALTGESLLLYCQTQLRSFDSTIKGYLDEQKLNLVRKKALGDIENTMKKYANVLTPEGQQECWNAWKNSIASLPAGDPLRTQLLGKYGELLRHPNSGFTKDEWAGYMGDVHSMLDDVSGNAEINMIQLQSVMSQRQTAVQLTTSILAKLDDGTKSILGNIGR